VGLLYAGDYNGARQLLAAMGRRLRRPRRRGEPAGRSASLADVFRAERERAREEHEVLARLVVPLEAGYRLALRRAPDVRAACEEALGPSPDGPSLLPLRDLLGLVGAHEWRRRGLFVPALGARIHPHHGVYAPVRGEPVELVARAAESWPVTGKLALDLGTGTGVLAFLLARAGARVIATDLEPRAVACARENAATLGLSEAVEVRRADLFPGERFDLLVSNPPWVPAEAHSALDRAVYDPGGRFLAALLSGIPGALRQGGEAWVVLSDLAERLGLRPVGQVEALSAQAGLEVVQVLEARPAHPRSRDGDDPLHQARSAEVTRLYQLRVRAGAR